MERASREIFSGRRGSETYEFSRTNPALCANRGVAILLESSEGRASEVWMLDPRVSWVTAYRT